MREELKMLPSFRFQFLSLVLLLTTPATSSLSQARASGRGNNAAVVQRQRQGTCQGHLIGKDSKARPIMNESSILSSGTKNPSSEGSNPSCRTIDQTVITKQHTYHLL